MISRVQDFNIFTLRLLKIFFQQAIQNVGRRLKKNFYCSTIILSMFTIKHVICIRSISVTVISHFKKI